MRNFIKNFDWVAVLLFFLAWLLKLYLSPLLILSGLIILLCQKSRTVAISAYFKEIAIVIDMFGNVIGSPLWNIWLKEDDGYNFGNRKDTISYVLALNNRLGTLSKSGKIWAKILDKIDKDHLEKTITNNTKK